MAFNPNLPANHAPVVSQELRDQLNGLKSLMDALETRIAALESGMSGTARNPGMGEFDPGFSDPPATEDLQNIQTFLNQLTTALNR